MIVLFRLTDPQTFLPVIEIILFCIFVVSKAARFSFTLLGTNGAGLWILNEVLEVRLYERVDLVLADALVSKLLLAITFATSREGEVAILVFLAFVANRFLIGVVFASPDFFARQARHLFPLQVL